MRELLSELRDWHAAGTPFALATVVAVRGSAPRAPGATMAVASTGAVAGSVSGGCVESDAYEVATETLTTGRTELRTYGISDDEAFGSGLTCGGTIDVLVRPFVAGRGHHRAAALQPRDWANGARRGTRDRV